MRDGWFRGWRPYLLLGVLCLCLYLPGLAAIPVLDRDEARFAQATRQMLESGDFLHIRFQDEARNNKPAGIYWLQAASVAALSKPQSTEIWPYRLPSVLGATLAVLFIFVFARTFVADPRIALIAAVLLAAALGTVAEAHIAKTDAALLAAVTAGQGSLGLIYLRTRAGARVPVSLPVMFWLAEISAVFLKGPIGPGLALTTAVTLSIADREVDWLRGLRPVSGLIVTALAVAPWLYAIEHATEGQFLQQSVGRDFFSKILGAQEAHGAPPLYYLALAFLTFWPGSLFLVPAVIGGWRRRALPAVRFLLAWLVPAWIGLELVPTKLPHYALPLYPALALLAAMAIIENSSPRWARIASMLLWSVATLAITAGLVVLPIRLGSGVSAIGVVSAIALLVLAAVLLLRCHEPWRITALLAAMSVALVISVASFVVPDLDRLWLSRAIATMIAAHPPAPGGLVVIGYNEPSLVFLLNGNFKTGVADALVAAGDEALVMTRMAGDFERILASRGLSGERIDSVSGTDYSNGQQMTLTLYKIEPK